MAIAYRTPIYAVPINGKLQFYNLDGSKAENNLIDGAVGMEINFDPSKEIPTIKVSYQLVICKDEEELTNIVKTLYYGKQH